MSRAVALGALLASVVAGCFGGAVDRAGNEAEERIVVTGSSTIAPLMAEVARRWEAEQPGDRIDVQTGGSSRGIADVRSGLAEVGMVSRSPKEGEDDLVWHPVARDGVALVVHRNNPVTELSDADVRGIYRGEIVDWSEVGGPPGPITVVSKAEGRSTLEVFLAHFGLESREIAADVVIGDNQQGIKSVAADPGAVGYVSVGTAEVEAARGVAIRLLPSDGVPASVATVAAGDFPVGRTLHLVTAGEPEGLVAEIVEYARSPAVHDLVRDQHLVPLIRPGAGSTGDDVPRGGDSGGSGPGGAG